MYTTQMHAMRCHPLEESREAKTIQYIQCKIKQNPQRSYNMLAMVA